MKKKVIMLMMGVMMFSLCACENQNADTANTAGSNIEKNISKQDTSESDKGEQGISEEKVVSETEKESTMELKNVLLSTGTVRSTVAYLASSELGLSVISIMSALAL